RPKVRDQVVTQLGKRGDAAVGVLREVLKPTAKKTVLARRNAVWALARVPSSPARAAVRDALADPDASVRQAAAHVVGVDKDAAARAALERIVVEDEPPLRLKAAEALGRIGRVDAVPALLESV